MKPILCLKISDYKQVVIIKKVTIREIFNLLRVKLSIYFKHLFHLCDYTRIMTITEVTISGFYCIKELQLEVRIRFRSEFLHFTVYSIFTMNNFRDT